MSKSGLISSGKKISEKDLSKIIDLMILEIKQNDTKPMVRLYVSKKIFDQGVNEGIFVIQGNALTVTGSKPYATYKKEAFVYVR